MGTALQKPWMADLPPEDIEFAKEKAAEAVKKLHGDKKSKLEAFRDVAAVHARIAGHRAGSFGEWVREELEEGVSEAVGTYWATIGRRYSDILSILKILPDDWYAWYLLAKEKDKLFTKALTRLQPGMGQKEIKALLKTLRARALTAAQRAETEKKEREKAAKKDAAAAAKEVFEEVVEQVRVTGTLKVAALTDKLETAIKKALKAQPREIPTDTIKGVVKDLLDQGKYLTEQIHTWVAALEKNERAFSGEAKEFVRHNYRDSMIADLQEVFK